MTGERGWATEAACRTANPDLFHPTVHATFADIRTAKAICQQCPVIEQCLTYALDQDDHFGIWGGLDDRERRRLQQQVA